MTPRLYAAGLALVVVLVAVLIYPTDGRRIRKVIKQCREAVMAENVDLLMKQISFNYSDDYGGSYLLMRKRIEGMFKRFDDFDITITIRSLDIDDDEASLHARRSVIASEGEQRGYLIGGADGSEDIRIGLAKEPYTWKVVRLDDPRKQDRPVNSMGLR